jgi:hypothetical protein
VRVINSFKTTAASAQINKTVPPCVVSDFRKVVFLASHPPASACVGCKCVSFSPRLDRLRQPNADESPTPVAQCVCCRAGNEWEPPPWLDFSPSLSGVNYVTHWKCDAAADTTHTHTHKVDPFLVASRMYALMGLGETIYYTPTWVCGWGKGVAKCLHPSATAPAALFCGGEKIWVCTSVGTFDPFTSLSL